MHIQKVGWIGLIPILVVLTGCQTRSRQEETYRVPVAVEAVSLGRVRQYLEYHGDIQAEFEIKVFSKIPDRIEAFYVKEGDPVKKGDSIAKVAATQIEQAVRQVEAALAAAQAQQANLKAEYERAQRLRQEDALSQQQFEAIRTQFEAVSAQVQQAEAAVISARSQFKDATITSPIDGLIGTRYLDVGDMALPSMPVVTVVQVDRMKVRCAITESDLGRLALGQEAEIRVPAYTDRIFKGRVTLISPVLDPMTRMATVEITVPNPDRILKAGMFAEVQITTGLLENVIVVPRYAVTESTSMVNDNGKDRVLKNYYVFVVNDSLKAEQRVLDVFYQNHTVLAVWGGVVPGEKLVVLGQRNLRDGMPVQIVEKEVR